MERDGDGRIRVMAIADSDSYLKWSAALLGALPGEGWDTDLAVVRSPVAPSADQVRAAVAGTPLAGREVPVRGALELRSRLLRERPDVLMLNCTGPVVDALAHALVGERRPVLVSGLPGISVPATERAWLYRSTADLFVLHSHREVAEFTDLGARLGATGAVGLATLPFLPEPRPRAGTGGGRPRVVFASQAKVPAERGQREQVLLGLAALAEARPDLEVVVKLRAREDEAQTHKEKYHYEALWRYMAARGEVRPDAVAFRTGPMVEYLEDAAGFVTVSSTAALEAFALDVPTLVLTDFGLNAEQINLVFEGSGVLGTLDDVRAARFRRVDGAWLRANYFHPVHENDWVRRLTALVAAARRGELPQRESLLTGPEQQRRRTRSLMRLSLPPTAVRQLGRARRRLRALRANLRGTLASRG
ncbi:DUF6716 putative glycosyltransferase [Nocardiopsis sp. CC223A]|uniref:DUF6716 putative glycosyltransferase n=1 Tax=Nocardiopsis sp. CC223A TaxID=3044051 RepID=UPI00278C3EF7|nr:DUF6716 putative glycosyltransferase [Nocardiopsis sp. CC223A]